jgi:hypothetical protein
MLEDIAGTLYLSFVFEFLAKKLDVLGWNAGFPS